MSMPKSPKGNGPPVDGPPGGRAWERVKQFSQARGLPVQVEPPQAGDSTGSSGKAGATPGASKARKRTRK